MNQMIGTQSIQFNNPPSIIASASIVGEKEGQGPLRDYFDQIIEDPSFGKNSWELGESEFVRQTCLTAIKKAGLKKSQIRYAFAGDLLGQLIASTFGYKSLEIPMFGLYGACSTAGESLSLAAMTVAAGYADYCLASASSHFGSAEKQFRFPLEYGNQRPLSATWTVTGCGAFILGNSSRRSIGYQNNLKHENDLEHKGNLKVEDDLEHHSNLRHENDLNNNDVVITGSTTGKIVDFGIHDSMNMGAAMAPAAADVIYQNLMDFQINPSYYDRIITGDLGKVGKPILIKLLKENGFDISEQHMDCGIEIFDNSEQDTHSGGSGCGCSAVTLAGFVLKKLRAREWNRVLFVPTGALLSTVSFNEGEPVPGIAHAVMIEARG